MGYAALQTRDMNAATVRIVLTDESADALPPPSSGMRYSPRLAVRSSRTVPLFLD
jgi:hypothetical protein